MNRSYPSFMLTSIVLLVTNLLSCTHSYEKDLSDQYPFAADSLPAYLPYQKSGEVSFISSKGAGCSYIVSYIGDHYFSPREVYDGGIGHPVEIIPELYDATVKLQNAQEDTATCDSVHYLNISLGFSRNNPPAHKLYPFQSRTGGMLLTFSTLKEDTSRLYIPRKMRWKEQPISENDKYIWEIDEEDVLDKPSFFMVFPDTIYLLNKEGQESACVVAGKGVVWYEKDGERWTLSE